MSLPWPPDPPPEITYYTSLRVACVAHGFVVGQVISITGNSLYNQPTAIVSEVVDVNTFKIANYSTDPSVGGGGAATPLGPSLSRTSNVVTGNTAAAHGFYPGLLITITGIPNAIIGGGISAIARVNNVVTVTTATPTGLTAGCTVQVNGVTDTTLNGTFVIDSVIDPLNFNYAQEADDASDSSGNVYDIWMGKFYVTSTPTTTSFTYKQTGPNNQTETIGIATPTGQIAAGQRNCVLIFETRQGYVTAPSPPLTIYADGSKHLLITNIPFGPANVISRILAFTEVNGGSYFYIPVPASVAGQQVSTSTVIPDNTATSILVDFSDDTLAGAISIDTAGNNLFAQVVLGPCLNVTSYASRMFWWGEYNKVQNFYNMGFEGGYNVLTAPLGWTVAGTGGLLVTSGDFGEAWKITQSGSDTGEIRQTCYSDPYGARILLDDTSYTFRLWLKASKLNQSGNVVCKIYDPASSVVFSTATIALTTASTVGGFLQADFNAKTPLAMPVTTLMSIYADSLDMGDSVILDEMEIIYTDRPYRDNLMRVSYVSNPEAFDGITGVLGPQNDESPLRCTFEIRDQLYILSADRLHTTKDLTSEPSSWTVQEVADRCGSISAFACDQGEDWAVWCTQSGLRIFEGQQPYKISQEIQTKWNLLNTEVQHKAWLTNDSNSRRIYIGMPTNSATAPDKLYVLDYRELDTASQISTAGSLRISFTGRMISSDLSRKWTIWDRPLNCGAVLIRFTNEYTFCVGAGNGQSLGLGSGHGNAYSLDETKYTDDDYGRIYPYYTTYFFVNHDQEQQIGVGSHRKLFGYLTAFLSGVGAMTITPLADSLENAWPSTPAIPMTLAPTYDFSVGLNVASDRCAFRLEPSPNANTTDVYFNTGKLIISMKQDPISPVAGYF